MQMPQTVKKSWTRSDIFPALAFIFCELSAESCCCFLRRDRLHGTPHLDLPCMEGCMEAMLSTSLHLHRFPRGRYRDAGICKRLETNVEPHGVNKQSSVELRCGVNVAVPRIMSTLDSRVKSGSFNDHALNENDQGSCITVF
jgi:hypothetical protein